MWEVEWLTRRKMEAVFDELVSIYCDWQLVVCFVWTRVAVCDVGSWKDVGYFERS